MVRLRSLHPLRLLVGLVGMAVAVVAALVSLSVSEAAPGPRIPVHFAVARADTDSVRVLLADSLRADSARTDALPADSLRTDSSRADSLLTGAAAEDTSLVGRYLRQRRRDGLAASFLDRRERPLGARLGQLWQQQVQLDSTQHRYTARETVGRSDVREPLSVDLDTYRRLKLRADMAEAWRQLVEQRARMQEQRREGLGLSIAIPGGRQSAFSTIFGAPDVNLRVNGQANIDAGFAYSKSDNQVALTARDYRLDPNFGQDIRLGITGSIGDKLQVNVNWNTENQFDYENQLKLEYTGYEDEIIRKIEAGNVLLQTQSQLIKGSQSLFGIKSELQIGGVHLTTVMSQQESESDALSIEGGSQKTEIDIRPSGYEDDTHFFLGYYFRTHFEPALENPRLPVLRYNRIEDVEVWKLNLSISQGEIDERLAVAVADLGEPRAVLDSAGAVSLVELPSPDRDEYDPAELDELRLPATPESYLKDVLGLEQRDYVVGRFKKLTPGVDFDFDRMLGYVSLKSRLNEGEALAVAFKYSDNNLRTLTVGDFSAESGGASGGVRDNRIVLKLLRQQRQLPTDPTWPLVMRNVYRIPARGFSPDDLDLQIVYAKPGSPPETQLRGVRRETLLNLLGLDRVNTGGEPTPDNKVDFLAEILDRGTGRVVFPYLEPFGARLAQVIDQAGVSNPEQAKQQLVFTQLYAEKQEQAARDTEHDVYRLRGEVKGGAQNTYNLGFIGVVPGSVTVRSNGAELAEGADYVVEYATGTVTIINDVYTAPGRQIEISFDKNQLFAIQKKTLLGVRADYAFRDNLTLGATAMRLTEKSPIDKFRIGQEPISNLIWGLDGSLDLQPRWLTRFVDWLPLIQTRAPSSVSIRAEFAQLRPDNAQTLAFNRTRRALQRNDRDFKDDELLGISYIDDFEGVKSTFSLKNAGVWRLAAAPIQKDHPKLNPGLTDSLRTHWRGLMGWYSIPLTVDVDTALTVRPIFIREVYPERDTQQETNQFLSTMDLYFDPSARGPYNYNPRLLTDFLAQPENAWGGITQRIPDGYSDFNLRNIDFIEFIVSPYSVDPATGQYLDAGENARLYLDLGTISEDVLPNGLINTEDGLRDQIIASDLDRWGRLSNDQPSGAVNVDETTRRTEDLGLDGLPSTRGDVYELSEEEFFKEKFLDELEREFAGFTTHPEYLKAKRDPSGDDYFYYGNTSFFGDPRGAGTEFFPRPGGATVQERFSRFFPGQELNTLQAQRQLAGGENAIGNSSQIPDSEDLNYDANLNTENSYHQYVIPLSRAELQRLAQPDQTDDFVVTEIQGSYNRFSSTWYLIRIPIRTQNRDVVGNIEDFDLIQSVRLWTTGHRRPMTVRFASFDLVGSQWQKSDKIGLAGTEGQTIFSVSTINNEENPLEYRIPEGTVQAQTRVAATGGFQVSREQAMVLRAENLLPGDERAVFKSIHDQLDLLKYENLRMFLHLHGKKNAVNDLQRGDVRIFLRLGSNETDDYYEYEQPLTPYNFQQLFTKEELKAKLSDPTFVDSLWQTNLLDQEGRRFDLNSLFIELGDLNKLKVERDDNLATGGSRLDSVYWKSDFDERATPGARIGIVGNPSLSDVSTLIIGVRNPTGEMIEDAEVWYNELRATGYDNQGGWAALGTANIKLADLAVIQANLNTQTHGFGGLETGLGERDNTTRFDWGLNANVNVNKFLPERFGWNIPVSFQMASDRATPRFSPARGDIELEQMLAQVDENQDLSLAQKQQRKSEIREQAESGGSRRSIAVPISKRGSKSALLRHTLDALSLSFNSSENESSTPSARMNDRWQWSGTASYRLALSKTRTIRPLWFVEDVPLVGSVLGGLRMSYLPQSLNLSTSTARDFSQSQDRPRFQLPTAGQPTRPDEPEITRYPVRQNHNLGHGRNLSFQYNPFTFLQLGYDSNVNQSLRGLAVDTMYHVAYVGADGRTYELNNIQNNVPAGDIDGIYDEIDRIIAEIEQQQGVEASSYKQIQPVPTGGVLQRLWQGYDGARTDNFGQQFNTSLRLPFDKIKPLNWITVQPITYSTNFGWQNGPVYTSPEDRTGASVSVATQLRAGVSLKTQEFWRKFGFYRGLEKAQKEAGDRRRQEIARADRERKERQEARQREKERRELLRERPELADSLARVDSLQLRLNPPPAAGADTAASRRGFRLPLPRPATLFRQAVLMLTGMRDFTVTYSDTRRNNASNVDGGYSFLDALTGDAPSLAYRLGIEQFLDLRFRDPFLTQDRLQVNDQIGLQRQLGAKTSLSPSEKLRVDLTWDLGWNANDNISYRKESDLIRQIATRNGTNQATVWAFGGTYDELLAKQMGRLQYYLDNLRDRDPANLPLTPASVIEDFRTTFLRGPGALPGNGMLPFPMPNWNVNYTGLSDLPLLRRFAQAATVRHVYTSTYNSDFRTNVVAPGDTTYFKVADVQVVHLVDELTPGAIRVNKRFTPLISLGITWKGGLQTELAWNKSNALALSEKNISNSQTDELSFRSSFQKRGMKIPLFPDMKLNNTLRFSLIVSRSQSIEERYRLQAALESALKGETTPDAGGIAAGGAGLRNQTRTSVQPSLSYAFSNRVTAEFFVKYDHLDSKEGIVPSSTNVNGGFNVRVSIAN